MVVYFGGIISVGMVFIMRYLVVSDTHMYNDIFENITKHFYEQVDIMIHCGDSSLPCHDPLLKGYHVVRGNHDTLEFPDKIILGNVLITHGHLFHVYHGYQELLDFCHQHHIKYCFHGHTHVPTYQIIEGIHFINPGSTMMNRGSYGFGTFALVSIEDDKIDVHFYHHTTFEEVDQVVLEEGLATLEEFKQLIHKYNK